MQVKYKKILSKFEFQEEDKILFLNVTSNKYMIKILIISLRVSKEILVNNEVALKDTKAYLTGNGSPF